MATAHTNFVRSVRHNTAQQQSNVCSRFLRRLINASKWRGRRAWVIAKMCVIFPAWNCGISRLEARHYSVWESLRCDERCRIYTSKGESGIDKAWYRMATDCEEFYTVVSVRYSQQVILSSVTINCIWESILNIGVRWPRNLVRWFSINMGTGIVSILLFTLPYNGKWLYWISVGLFGLNVVLFCAFLLLSILRYSLYPGIWGTMIREPVQSMFIGTLPMGFATIIDMMAFVCVPAWGPWVAIVAWAFWIVDAIVSAACALCLPFLLSVYPRRSLLLSRNMLWT